jgi:hypothetical protein
MMEKENPSFETILPTMSCPIPYLSSQHSLTETVNVNVSIFTPFPNALYLVPISMIGTIIEL